MDYVKKIMELIDSYPCKVIFKYNYESESWHNTIRGQGHCVGKLSPLCPLNNLTEDIK